MIKVAPSILSADLADLGNVAVNTEKWGADLIHYDVMDGSFVPALTYGVHVMKAMKKHTSLPFDVHLMTEHPETFIPAFCEAGADIITFHVEAEAHVHRVLQLIKSFGVKAGVALCPSTSLDTVEYVLGDCDMILLMTVNPGAGGQKFIPAVVPKIAKLRKMAEEAGHALDIEIDGGVNKETSRIIREAGANVLVAGSAVYGAADPQKAIKEIRGDI